jgi:hypothetical protein
MKKLTEAEMTLLIELDIPENVAHLAPEACTCGVDGCAEHQNWGNKIMDSIFKDFAVTGDQALPDLLAQIEELKNFKFPDTK